MVIETFCHVLNRSMEEVPMPEKINLQQPISKIIKPSRQNRKESLNNSCYTT